MKGNGEHFGWKAQDKSLQSNVAQLLRLTDWERAGRATRAEFRHAVNEFELVQRKFGAKNWNRADKFSFMLYAHYGNATRERVALLKGMHAKFVN